MSIEAINWALKLNIKHSSAKFILVAIANCADGSISAHGQAWLICPRPRGKTAKPFWPIFAGYRMPDISLIRVSGAGLPNR